MANQIIGNPSRVLDLNGYTVPGAKMTVYQTGTATLLDVFSDLAGVVPAANPIIADASGIFPQRYVTATAAKVVVTTSDDVTLYTLDPVSLVQANGSGASQISFSPTAEVPATDVQAAIEAVSMATANTQLAGRNRIMNGQGRVNARGYVSGTATGAANQYTLDRWRVVTSGQSLTFIGTEARRTMTAPAGGVEQEIEGRNIEGGTYVINWTGTATCTVNGIARAKEATFGLPYDTDVTVRFTGGTFTDVQLELGETATPFERLTFSEELAHCQRYFENLRAGVIGESATIGRFIGSVVSFATQKRVAPTVTRLFDDEIISVGTPYAEFIGADGFRATAQTTATGTVSFITVYSANAEM
jgi:hypothetical protein